MIMDPKAVIADDTSCENAHQHVKKDKERTLNLEKPKLKPNLTSKPRMADSSFMHQFAGSNSYTSLEYLKAQLDEKIRELTISGKVMLNQGETSVALASEIISDKSIAKRLTIQKVEEFVTNVTPEEIQAICDAKERNRIQKNAQIKINTDNSKKTKTVRSKAENGTFGNAQLKQSLLRNLTAEEKGMQSPSLERDSSRSQNSEENINEYGKGPKIKDSVYNSEYQKINQLMLNSYPETKEHYHKCMSKSCQKNQFCTFTKMDPLMDNSAFRTQPLAYGTSTYARQFNERYSNTDFPDRNLALKKGFIKVVATEESLNDWHAQSLDITAEKLIKYKKFLGHLMKQQSGSKVSAINKKDKKSASALQAGDKRKTSPKEQKTQSLAAMGQDINTLIAQSRPGNYSTKIKHFEDLKPMIYSKYQNQQSYLTQQEDATEPRSLKTAGAFSQDVIKQVKKQPDLRRRSEAKYKSSAKMAQSINKNRMEHAGSQSATHLRKSGRYAVTQGQKERRQLLQEIGGFSSKHIYQEFQKQKKERQVNLDKQKLHQQEYESPQAQIYRSLANKNELLVYQQQKKELKHLLVENRDVNKSLKQKKLKVMRQMQAKSMINTTKNNNLRGQSAVTRSFQHLVSVQRKYQQSPQIQENPYQSGPQGTKYQTISLQDQAQQLQGQKSRSNTGLGEAFNVEPSFIENQLSEYFQPTPQATRQLPRKGLASSTNHFMPSRTYLEHQGPKSESTRHISQIRIKSDLEKVKRCWVTGGTSDLESLCRTDLTQNWHQRTDTDLQKTNINFQEYVENDHIDINHVMQHQTRFQTDTIQPTSIAKPEQNIHLNSHKAIKTLQDDPNQQISSNENIFFEMNRTFKGIGASSEKTKRLFRISQETCFRTQKQDIIQQALQKDNFVKKLNKREVLAEQERNASIGSASQHASILEQERKKNVLWEIEQDNLQDIENPFVSLEYDKRVVKINISSHDIEPDPKLRNQKLNFQDAEFWYIKGYEHAHSVRNELESAIDSYRQAIRLNPSYIEAMHNLACSYEEQQRYNLGRKWFDSALKLDGHLLDAYHGYALCAFKEGDALSAVLYLDKAVEQLGDQDIKDRQQYHKIYFRYLRALCNKTVMDFQKAQKDYCDIQRAFEIQEGRLISLNIFGMVMMPLELNRKKLLKAVETFKTILDRYEEDKDRKVLAPHYIDFEHIDKTLGLYKGNKNPKWFDKRIQDVIKVLRKRYFFKRFSLPRVREMIDKMHLSVIGKKEILFFQSDKVYVIVSGSIVMKNHEKQTDIPETLAKFGPGDILNFLQDQSEIFNSIETWFVAQVETEVAIFDYEYFNNVWNQDLMTEKLLLKRSIIQSHPLFSTLSELTIMSLVSEIFQYKTFYTADVILPQSQYSPTLQQGKIYFQNRASKFAEKIKTKKIKNKKGGKMSDSPRRAAASTDNELPNNRESVAESKENTRLNSASRGQETSRGKNSNTARSGDAGQEEGMEKQTSEVSPVEAVGAQTSDQKEEGGDGFFLITHGKCRVVNHDDGYCFQELKKGDFFGESEIIKSVGFGFFGDIIADSPTVECMFIPVAEFKKIPTFEQIQIKKYADSRSDIKMLGFQYSRKYGIDIMHYTNYYS